MTTITLHLPDNTPLQALHNLADAVDCDLRKLPDGSYCARPRNARSNSNGNSNVVKMPRHRKQFMHTTIQTEPEPA